MRKLSCYDDEFISYLSTTNVTTYQIIENTDGIVDFIMENFRFQNGRVYLEEGESARYIQSDGSKISRDSQWFINKLISQGLCDVNEKVIYVGDSLTECGYEFYVHDLLKVITYLMEEIPQHHYFLFGDKSKLMYVSFENEIQFGGCL